MPHIYVHTYIHEIVIPSQILIHVRIIKFDPEASNLSRRVPMNSKSLDQARFNQLDTSYY
jgi:hypothetical protein